MKVRAMQVVGAIVLTAVLALGLTVPPVGANPTDTYLPTNVTSEQYDLGGCLYKVMNGYFFTAPATAVWVYNPTVCGSVVALVEYVDGAGTTRTAHSTAVASTGSDGCGAFQMILAFGTAGPTPWTTRRGLVWSGTGARWYANDGLVAQPIHAFC